MSRSLSRAIGAAVKGRILACLATCLFLLAAPAQGGAGELTFDLLIEGGAAGLTNTFADESVTFLMSEAPRDVHLVEDGEMQSEPIGTAWVGAVNDPRSGPLFGPLGIMVLFDFADSLNFQAHAGALHTSAGRISTFAVVKNAFSARGEWRLGDAGAVAGASDNDALLHVTVDLHLGPAPFGDAVDVIMTDARILWQRDEILASGETIRLRVLRNSAVALGDLDTGVLSGTVGAASSYQLCNRASSVPCLTLYAVRVGATQVLGVRAGSDIGESSCGLGGDDSLPAVSAECRELTGSYVIRRYDGVTEDDQVLRIHPFKLNTDDPG